MQQSFPCSVLKYLTIVPGSRSDYESLAVFHYRDFSPGPIRFVYKLIDGHSRRRLEAPVVGVIVYGPPAANLAARGRATGGAFRGLSRAAGLTLLNARLVCIRRVIVEPRYRGLGLASRLVRETMPLTGAAMVEAVSVMGRVHPFFVRAGMTEFACPPDAKTERLKAAMEAVGIGEGVWHDGGRVHAAVAALPEGQKAFIVGEMDRFVQKFTRQRAWPHSVERTDFVLGKLADPGRYYLWQNPEKGGCFSF
ncbi:MAG: hypothetical protein L0Y36_08885 [Planctomycetales bacterium]|nr:hypothetical protein [Planctomycetales bacterium]